MNAGGRKNLSQNTTKRVVKGKRSSPKPSKDSSKKPEIFGVAEITTYDTNMHRLQFTQLTIQSEDDITKEVLKIVERYSDRAFTSSIYIQWRPFHEWPKKWREV